MTVRLAAGTFVGPITISGKPVRLEGAGAGQTTLRGFGAGPALTVAGAQTADTVVTGLAVTGAAGEGGFGLLADGTAATFGDVRFMANAGGGACVRGGSPAFHACSFQDNRGQGSGGGLRNEGGSPVLVGCTFARNVAGSLGGGIYSDGGSVTVVDCVLQGNATRSGAWGGGIFAKDATIDAHGTTFTGNTAIEAGGAVYLLGGRGDLSGCTFAGNLAERARSVFSRGAGVSLTGSALSGASADALGGDVTGGAGTTFGLGADHDCNGNGIDDAQEVAMGWAKDLDGNGKPDACDRDCNSNGVPDAYEIARGWAADEDHDGMIDFCEIQLGLAEDVNHDWIPDSVQQLGGYYTDGVTPAKDVEAMRTKAARAEAHEAAREADAGMQMPGLRGMRMAAER
jgi:predicted outer membrane repeat protein